MACDRVDGLDPAGIAVGGTCVDEQHAAIVQGALNRANVEPATGARPGHETRV
jgi:hypothetical protein